MSSFNRGAKVVPFYNAEACLAVVETARRLFKDRFNKQWNALENVTGSRLRAVANRARQRKKGPIVRFGGRVYP